jgi:SRSO17 transposase
MSHNVVPFDSGKLSIASLGVHAVLMTHEIGEATTTRVIEFFGRIGQHLQRKEQRESFATYAFGILGEGERKSIEPIAARAAGEPEATCRLHDRLLHFVRESPWDDRAVRREAAQYVLTALSEREAVTTWIIDDTGMLKQGKHSPGVQRQYTGSAGKVTNCQIAVSLSLATRTEQVPVDFELYVPESWATDPKRRKRARIPDSVVFKTKVELALDMISRAAEDGLPGEVMLADSFYGRSHVFRDTVRLLGFDYAVAVDSDTHVWLLDAHNRRRGTAAVSVQQVGLQARRGSFRRVTWRDGTKSKLGSRFLFRRVRHAHDDGTDPADREPIWLVIEWPEGERTPTKFFFTTLRQRMSKKQIVRIIKERWKTERVYEELKGELGFDHYEGRSFVGWHHHISVVLSCYAFVVAERVRAFPPSAGRPRSTNAVALAA